MLVNLHVKNFAIIDEADVDFTEGLNILTGETGAGKSILIGSLNIALGARVSSDVIGRASDSALVEAVFTTEDEEILELIRGYDIEPEDSQIVISRKLSDTRSVNRINGVTVPAATIKAISSRLIDIHGQNENQSLLHADKQREVLDRFAGDEAAGLLDEIGEIYKEYAELKKEIENDDMTTGEVAKQIDRLTFIKDEIENARLTPEEMADIDDRYKEAYGAADVVDALASVYENGTKAAGDSLSRVISDIKRISSGREKVEDFAERIIELEGLISDLNRDISAFMQDFSFDEGQLRELEKRMDTIHTLQSKYGQSYDDIQNTLKDTINELEHFSDYESYRVDRQSRFDAISDKLNVKCDALTELRKKTASKLSAQISEALSELNFAGCDFAIDIKRADKPAAHGQDEVEFIIAPNPGEPLRGLAKIASGGELSRIMLAIKSVFADSDDIDTMIFDEIDAGISGRTAQMVAQKLLSISRHHQIICITHLAQIAAMADTHFVIEKEVEKDRSTTRIRRLEDDETQTELSRILGGVEITDAVIETAAEMKRLADEMKN